MPLYFDQAEKCVDQTIEKVGKKLRIGTPLAAGKPNLLLNAFYQRAKKDATIELTILTALTLEKPKGKSFLEKRFMGPFADRVFGDYPDLEYELDRTQNRLPENIKVIEFYFPAGKYMNNTQAQRDYISTNYTHVYRDMLDMDVNVLAQMVCQDPENQTPGFSLSCNPDVTLDLIQEMRRQESTGKKVALLAQVNQNLPFMYGDAVVPESSFDFVFEHPDGHYKIFGPPKMSVSEADFMIGFYCSALIKDDGELQVGIGSIGDAIVYGLLLRQNDNAAYKKMADKFQLDLMFSEEIKRSGGLASFKTGLLGATEMLVDGFIHLYKAGVVKRKVYDSIPLQRLLNENKITEDINDEFFETLLKTKVITEPLTEAEFDFLQHFGIFKGPEQLKFVEGELVFSDNTKIKAQLNNPETLSAIKARALGKKLKHGTIMHGGFFLGPNDFYQSLKDLPTEERKLINMRSVRKINQLYGHEELDRMHRKNARFINTCMMMTLTGAAVSDGLEDGRVVSGVGGQYNFVSMAQELPDGRSILNLRSTRTTSKGILKSSFVTKYGHITIPRHLRDIVVSEYGIADIRGRTDEEVAKRLLNITDSRFQNQLLNELKSFGKIAADYMIPEMFRNNYPSSYAEPLKELKNQGYFPPFPFGTDLNEEEKVTGKALKYLKKETATPGKKLQTILKALLSSRERKFDPYLKRMQLDQPKDTTERLYQKLLIYGLKQTMGGSN